MYSVTFIGKTGFEQKTIDQNGLDELARNLQMEPFDLIRGLEPAIVVKSIKTNSNNLVTVEE